MKEGEMRAYAAERHFAVERCDGALRRTAVNKGHERTAYNARTRPMSSN
jgi:hypothetical protein